MTLSGAAFAMRGGPASAQQAPASSPSGAEQVLPPQILLKDYRPKSIYKIPKSDIKKAKYPLIDVHCHGARPIAQLDDWVKAMDAAGVEKAVIFTGANTGERFSQVRESYSKYPGRFDLWCGFDFTGALQPGFGPNAVKALEECHRLGALGVGEISDKGLGYGVSAPRASRGGAGAGGVSQASTPPTPGPHPDDSRMDALWEKCAQLGMPINIHMSDPIWSYDPMDNTNDGLMNGYTWRIDDKKPGILGHNGLLDSMERTLEKHRKTVFIACHLANLDYDLTRLGQMFDRNPNLYGDISARFAELAPIPRFVNQFFQKYADRILYGTDNTYSQGMFSATFRLLETSDEHFYEDVFRTYHWPFYGFGLPDEVLKKLYRDNAVAVFRRARSNAG
jgi:predicted TIM-barrel fold metal-dependent hydrolase